MSSFHIMSVLSSEKTPVFQYNYNIAGGSKIASAITNIIRRSCYCDDMWLQVYDSINNIASVNTFIEEGYDDTKSIHLK